MLKKLSQKLKPFSTNLSRQIIRSVLSDHPKAGLPNQQLYQACHEKFPNARETQFKRKLTSLSTKPPYEEHPIRSMAFLKRFLLKDLADQGLIEKVRVTKGIQPRDPNEYRVDTIHVNKLEKETCPEVVPAKEEEQWRWRLVKDRDTKWDELDKEDFVPYPPSEKRLHRGAELAERREKALADARARTMELYKTQNPGPSTLHEPRSRNFQSRFSTRDLATPRKYFGLKERT